MHRHVYRHACSVPTPLARHLSESGGPGATIMLKGLPATSLPRRVTASDAEPAFYQSSNPKYFATSYRRPFDAQLFMAPRAPAKLAVYSSSTPQECVFFNAHLGAWLWRAPRCCANLNAPGNTSRPVMIGRTRWQGEKKKQFRARPRTAEQRLAVQWTLALAYTTACV